MGAAPALVHLVPAAGLIAMLAPLEALRPCSTLSLQRIHCSPLLQSETGTTASAKMSPCESRPSSAPWQSEWARHALSLFVTSWRLRTRWQVVMLRAQPLPRPGMRSGAPPRTRLALQRAPNPRNRSSSRERFSMCCRLAWQRFRLSSTSRCGFAETSASCLHLLQVSERRPVRAAVQPFLQEEIVAGRQVSVDLVLSLTQSTIILDHCQCRAHSASQPL
mmetsp:Transcript_2414/g.5148  ORF Transcript_2414/g.5148 Transcript_2414/m.5148 type:complete len:220 (+) Transcript_2414:669-1328(+)